MITFDGYISGKAEKRFIEKQRNFVLFLVCQAFVLVAPLWFAFTSHTNQMLSVCLYAFLVVSIILLVLVVTKSKKENSKIIPHKIYTDGEYITAVSKTNVETRKVDWVKEVIDHSEFYELKFPVGKISNTFICQKDLLTQGTLKEFERIFKDKLIKK